MDEDVSRWILEFLLRSPHLTDRSINALLSTLPIHNDSSRFKKTLLLRRIQSSLVSYETLALLELIAELDDGSASASMKSAYCALAVECTVRHLRGGRGRRREYFEAVRRVWRGRVGRMMGKEGVLVGEDLMRWKDEIEDAAWDDEVAERVLGRDTSGEAERSVREYLEEAWGELGRPFLEVAAEAVGALGGMGRGEERRVSDACGVGTGVVVEGGEGGCQGGVVAKEDVIAACDDGGIGEGQENGNADEAVVANRDLQFLDHSSRDYCISKTLVGYSAETGKGKSKVQEKHLGPRGRRFKSVARRIRGVTIARIRAVETSESMGKDDHIPSSPDDNTMQEPPPPKHSSMEPQKILVDRPPSTRTMTEEISAMVRSDNAMYGVAAKVNHITQELHSPISHVDGAAAEGQQKQKLPCWVEGCGRNRGGQDGDNHNHPAARNAQDRSRGSDASEWDGLAEKLTRSASHCSSLPGPKNSPKTGNLSPLGGVLAMQGKSAGRRQRKAWSPLEEDTLRNGVKEFGIGSWSRIYKTYREIFKHRTDVDLKDKWRNLSR
ncbi:Single myb histone 3-like protein [Drosera capensis]